MTINPMQPTLLLPAQPLLGQFVGLMQVANAFYRGNTANLPRQMAISQSDVQSLFHSLNRFGVHYLLVVGMANIVHGYVRTTVTVGKRGFALDMGHSLKAFADTDFDTCYARAHDTTFDDVSFKVIHLTHLITEKLATSRPKDLGDVNKLEKIGRLGLTS